MPNLNKSAVTFPYYLIAEPTGGVLGSQPLFQSDLNLDITPPKAGELCGKLMKPHSAVQCRCKNCNATENIQHFERAFLPTTGVVLSRDSQLANVFMSLF